MQHHTGQNPDPGASPRENLSHLAPHAGIDLPRYVHTPPAEESALTRQMRQLYAPGVPQQVELGDDLLIDGLHATAGRFGRRVALDFFGRTWTYRELVKQVQITARLLADMGVQSGDRVSILLPNCPQFVFTFYACLQLGAVAALHNPTAAVGELDWQLRNCTPKVIVAWQRTVDAIWPCAQDLGAALFGVNLSAAMPWTKRWALRLPVAKARALRQEMCAPTPPAVLDFDSARRHLPPLEEVRRIDVDLPAVLLHTGGTTGKPKAVILTNRNLVSNSEANARWVTMLKEGAETWYCVLPFFHAFGLNLTLTAMIRMGATAVLFPKFSVDMVLAAQKRRRGTFILGVPPIFDRLTKQARARGVDMTSFRYAISGAMPISAEVAAAWEECCGGYVVEGYGMTETSPTILGSPFSPARRPGYLGIVFPSIQVRVVDPDNPTRDVPLGEIGELIVKGPGCSPGYWRDREETARLFSPEGWLRTGDLVVVEEGFIRLADRLKELIITGGFNVYPSEVEAAVRTLPGVKDVAVVGVPDGQDAARGEEVRAVLVLEEGAKVTLAQVRQWAEKSLSHYALPRSISILSELPYSQLGKVMRRKVREQILGNTQSATPQDSEAQSAARRGEISSTSRDSEAQ